MINYTDINSVLPLIARAVREEDTIPNLSSYILDGYRLIYSPVHTTEGVLILQVKDHKAKLPSDVKVINLATYMSSNPDTDDVTTLPGIQTRTITIDLTTSDETNECVGNYILSHKLFLLSDYFNNNFEPIKYIGTSKFVCTNCNNRFCHACNQTYSVDENKMINTSFKEGYICLLYETELKVDGKFQIVDNEEVKFYLARFAELEHFRNRMYSQEQGAGNIVGNLESKVNIWYNKARTAIKKLLLNRPLITELTTGRFNARFLQHGATAYRNNDEI